MQPVSSDAPCISRRIIGKNTQDAVRHGQARVSGGFSHTLPILAGFLFLGFAYGLLMRTKGFFVPLPDVHGDDNFRRFAGICHRVDAAHLWPVRRNLLHHLLR